MQLGVPEKTVIKNLDSLNKSFILSSLRTIFRTERFGTRGVAISSVVKNGEIAIAGHCGNLGQDSGFRLPGKIEMLPNINRSVSLSS